MKTGFVLLILLIASSTFAQSVCQDKNLPQMIADGSNALRDSQLTHAIASKQVTVVGEMHFYTELKPRLEIIEAYNKIQIGRKCVAYEFAQKDGKDFHDYLSLLEGMTKNVRLPEFRTANPQLTDEMITDYVKAVQSIIDYYQPMAQRTRELGMKAIMVDSKDHNFETSQTMDQRNEAMALNLKNALEKDCDSVLFFVGKAHLSFNVDSSTKLQELLDKQNVSRVTINLQMTREFIPRPLRGWMECFMMGKDFQVGDYAFFENSKLSENFKIYPYMKDTSVTWKDFDFTLLTP